MYYIILPKKNFVNTHLNILLIFLKKMQFAYVTFVTPDFPYIDLMKSTIDSVIQFSKHPIIVYCINFYPDNLFAEFINHQQVIFRSITNILSNVYYYKPLVIYDALNQGLMTGYYIESDDIITPFADSFLENSLTSISHLPLSPIHPNSSFIKIPLIDFEIAGCNKISQPYVHGHILFTTNCLPFIFQWLDICISTHHSFENADETILNLLYWKYDCKNHYLPIIDPYFNYFYTTFNIDHTFVCTFHGCKDPMIQNQLLQDLKKKFI